MDHEKHSDLLKKLDEIDAKTREENFMKESGRILFIKNDLLIT